jgi:hypothetical protein
MRLQPKNWRAFQHYKDRSPPWIKFHRDLLTNREFMCLPIASKALAPLLWLIASESKDVSFDATFEELEFRLHITRKDYDEGLKPLIDKGFFVIASGVLADCLQDASAERETETEEEKETEGKKREKVQRGTRLPANWEPSDEDIAYCKKERPDLQWQRVAENFRDYWLAQAGSKAVKMDWSRVWKTWVRNEKGARTYESAKDRSRREIIEGLTGKKSHDTTIIDI